MHANPNPNAHNKGHNLKEPPKRATPTLLLPLQPLLLLLSPLLLLLLLIIEEHDDISLVGAPRIPMAIGPTV